MVAHPVGCRFLVESVLLNGCHVSCSIRCMSETYLRHAIGQKVSFGLSGETSHPLKKDENMSKTEERPVIELTHEKVVQLVSELENGYKVIDETNAKTKDEIKKLKDARRVVSKSVFGRVPMASFMVSEAVAKGITSIKKVSDDSGVSISTISRYEWIGTTLSNVGLTKTSEKLATKSLNLLIGGVLKKQDMLSVRDVESWKQLIQDKTFKLPSAPKFDSVREAIGNGSYDEYLNDIETAVSTRRKMMVKA